MLDLKNKLSDLILFYLHITRSFVMFKFKRAKWSRIQWKAIWPARLGFYVGCASPMAF